MLHYRRHGNGPALVMQHGFLSGSGYWVPQLGVVGKAFDVIAPDLPGCAGSARRARPELHRGAGGGGRRAARRARRGPLRYYRLCYEAGRSTRVEAPVKALGAVKRWDARSRLAQLKLPTLVLCGDRDRSIALDEAYVLRRESRT